MIATSPQPRFCAKEGRRKFQSCPWRNLISFKHFSLTLVLQFMGGEFQNQGNHVTSFELIVWVEEYVNKVVSLFFCVLSYFSQFQFISCELTSYELLFLVFPVLFDFITIKEWQLLGIWISKCKEIYEHLRHKRIVKIILRTWLFV